MSDLKRCRVHRFGKWVLVSLAFVALCITLLTVYLGYRRTHFQMPDTRLWQTGDIFFSSGNSWRSEVVRLVGGSTCHRTSHCGFIIIKDGAPQLVHMSVDKNELVSESVSEYARVNDVGSIHAMRLKQLPDTALLRRNIEKLLASGKRFDNNFDLSDTTEYYCTELVVRELERAGAFQFHKLCRSDYIYPQYLESSSVLSEVSRNAPK